MSEKGRVYLVGAGPGDPDLITVRAQQVLREADVVIFDALAPVELLNAVKVGCELIDAGKRSGHHRLEQQQIIRLLQRHAKAGKSVVRLKGGDPFIFGRGGEEGESLRKAGIPFEVVPGVSSVTAVPAYAGIPLTHREVNSSVTILTGHGGRQESAAPLDWRTLAKQEVLVMLMGLNRLGRNMKQLQQHGKPGKTPVAVIEWGTIPRQRTVVGTVATIEKQIKASQIQPPVVIVVGDTVRRRRFLNWYEQKPLFGKHILVTRARHQAGEITQRLRAEAALVTEIPTIQIDEPASYSVLDRAIRDICQFQWIIFTSMNGVDAFFERLYRHRFDGRALAAARLACIGPATADRLTKYGVRADVIARRYQAEGLLAQLPARLVRDRRILLPRAAQARDILPNVLKKRGAYVTVAPAYRALIPSDSRRELRRLIKETPPDLLTFASSSMVENFVAILKSQPSLLRKARQIPAACIGPITGETARRLKLNVVIQPREFTIPALVEAIVRKAKRKL